jgi:hypothetical protein
MLAMGDMIGENAPKMTRTSPNIAQSCELKYDLPGAVKIDGSPFFASERMSDNKGKLPRAVVFGDSFSRYLVPYLSESFGRAVFLHIWDSNPTVQKLAIENEMPDIVIDEIVERLLKRFLAEPVEQEVVDKDYRKLFDRSSHILNVFDYRTKYEGILPAYQVKASLKSFGNSRVLKLHAAGDDPIVQLPAFSYPSTKHLLVKIDITSQKDTVLQLFYMTNNTTEYSESKSVSQPINKGRNVLYIPLRYTDISGKIRLDPGKVTGDYLIHSIEVRAIPKVVL